MQKISERGEDKRSGHRNIWRKSDISHIETKKKMASLKTVGKIAEALGVSIESITGNPMESNNPKNYEIDLMFDDLNAYERAVLKDVLIATKRALRENKGIMD